jgi:uncharacterized repeat protein (TIGR02543 family)
MSGQLGDGTVTTDKIFPTEITGNFDLNTGEKITQICIEMDHSSAITSEGRLYFWGLNNDGQLGDGTTKNKSLPTDITGNFELNTGEKIIDASLGYFHSAALTSQGRLFIWGGGHYGQLGDGAMYIRYLPYDITGKFDLHADETVKQISLGSYNSSALTSEGRLFTWGNNDYGQLGDGTTETRILPTNITDKFLLNSGETINKISLGFCDYSSAMTSESRLFIWGKNQYGPLGDGTTTNKLVPSEIVFCHPEVIKSQMYDLNEEILSYTPTKEGYTFSGWYCDLSFADRFDLIAMPAKKIILYCKFILNNN